MLPLAAWARLKVGARGVSVLFMMGMRGLQIMVRGYQSEMCMHFTVKRVSHTQVLAHLLREGIGGPNTS
jgi:hypothetical protein